MQKLVSNIIADALQRTRLIRSWSHLEESQKDYLDGVIEQLEAIEAEADTSPFDSDF